MVEVKSISCPNPDKVDIIEQSASRELQTAKNLDGFRPEENVHPRKLQRLYRAIETYLAEKNMENEWQLDVAVVYLDTVGKRAKVSFLENIV